MAESFEEAAAQLYAQGVELARKSRWSEAETTFREAVRLAPKASLAWLSAAIACSHQERFEDAATAVEQALHVAIPIRQTPESELGVARFDFGNWRGVEEAFRQLLPKQAVDSPTHLFLAIALIRQKRFQEGVDQLMAGYRMEIAESESEPP
jgi:tetratricopeptide (TPR) repeat protein